MPLLFDVIFWYLLPIALAQSTIPTAPPPEQTQPGIVIVLASEVTSALAWHPPQLVPSDNCGNGNGCPGSWWVQTAPDAKGGSIHGTIGPDPFVELTFTGSSASVFGRTLPNGANGLASIDAGTNAIFPTESGDGIVHEQQVLWTSPTLDGTQQHILRVQFDPAYFGATFDNRSWLQLDYFQFTTDKGTASSSSSANSGSTSSQNHAQTTEGNLIPTTVAIPGSSEGLYSTNNPISTNSHQIGSPTSAISGGNSASFISSSTSSTGSNQTNSVTKSSHASPVGAIAGGVVGGLAVLMAGFVGIFYLRRRYVRESFGVEAIPNPLSVPSSGLFGRGPSMGAMTPQSISESSAPMSQTPSSVGALVVSSSTEKGRSTRGRLTESSHGRSTSDAMVSPPAYSE